MLLDSPGPLLSNIITCQREDLSFGISVPQLHLTLLCPKALYVRACMHVCEHMHTFILSVLPG